MANDEREALDFEAWCERCARRIGELDEQISMVEAKRLARDVYSFERTRAMGPVSAAEFVAVEMSRPDRGPFERRSAAR
ncbi:MAG: hypothetical protein ABI330_03755 [Caldimonas sp.]|nr:hypothetical protein [Pseudomonadota bacterium]